MGGQRALGDSRISYTVMRNKAAQGHMPSQDRRPLRLKRRVGLDGRRAYSLDIGAVWGSSCAAGVGGCMCVGRGGGGLC